MGLYGNKIININDIVLELYTNDEIYNLLIENYIIESEQEPVKYNFKMDIGGDKTVRIHIRNKAGGGYNNSSSKHGASIKIASPRIESEEVQIKIKTSKDDKSTVNSTNKSVIRQVNNKYKDILEFADKNYKTIQDIWNCKNVNEFDKLMKKLEDDNKNYNIRSTDK